MKKIIVDTSVWINFFNRPKSKEKQTVDHLLDEERVCFSGIVLSELLQGTKNEKEANLLVSKLSTLIFLETNTNIWMKTGLVSANLRRKGVVLPLSDILLAVTAQENECEVYTLDPHFKLIPGTELFNPE